jgi:DNA polymerase-3 subunit delta
VASKPPTTYFFYGSDQLAIAEAVDQMRSNPKLGDPSLNVQRFDAGELDLSELEQAAMAMPFLGERRLVILEHFEHLAASEQQVSRFLTMLDELPDSTALVITQHLSSRELKNFTSKSKVYAWCEKNPGVSLTRLFAKPTGSAFVRWLMDRVQSQGRQLEPDAAQLLAQYLDEDTLRAHQEIEKLLAYLNSDRAIAIEDVELLTPSYIQSGIFAMVDAIGTRDAKIALRHLHTLLASEPPSRVFSMIVRQFRMLLLAKELLARGENPAEGLQKIPLRPKRIGSFEAGKVSGQAANFDSAQLKEIYTKLIDLDHQSKRGKQDLAVELESLVALNS